MKTIHRPDDGRITIAEAKSLILGALPAEEQASISMHVDSSGELQWDGPVEVDLVNEPMATGFMTNAVLAAMREGQITPRVPFNPAFTAYKGTESDDDRFKISHKEFEAFAELFDCRVAVGEPPAIEQTSVTHQPEESIDFAMLATPDQLIQAFGRFTGMDASWFDKWADYTVLKDAIKVKGTSGRGRTSEPLFCPFLVMQGLIKKPRRGSKRQAFRNEETPWRKLKEYFPRVYDMHQGQSPLGD